jgi:hypothetical protein
VQRGLLCVFLLIFVGDGGQRFVVLLLLVVSVANVDGEVLGNFSQGGGIFV